MHFEAPKVKLHNIKEFFSHYLMIVISIVTALALEQGLERLHHAHQAEAASQQIQAEIHANLDAVRATYQGNEERIRKLAQIDRELVQDINRNLTVTEISEHMKHYLEKDFNLGLRWPGLRREAWEVAVANQSLAFIEPEELRRFSISYARQRDVQNGLSGSMLWIFNAQRMMDMLTDFELGKLDPKEMVHVLRQMQAIFSETQGNLKEMEKQLLLALPGNGEVGPGGH